MENSTVSASPIAGLLNRQEYQSQRSHVFPGVESLNWYLRSNRSALADGEAILYIAGRLWIRPEAFDQCVMAVGAAAARKAAA